ncbi:MAG: hypothetical protein F6K37_06950 [Moorea sp. SIO4E2]|uniref:hypothetical protein n=1 Tax=Moorena sp. SIO4E2 TaxID=2607826 RepID=UPI0013BCDA85|nr:hypothetical protein [Moorena sp. SIO4E2]NEQ05702.1 hypothetical protein [Moorena sp. SIO4E2]
MYLIVKKKAVCTTRTAVSGQRSALGHRLEACATIILIIDPGQLNMRVSPLTLITTEKPMLYK